MTATTIARADAALLGWLDYAARCDSSHDDAIDEFVRYGERLVAAGYAVGECDIRAAAAWRALAARGVDLIGPAFGLTDIARPSGKRREARRRDLGCRLYAGNVAVPTPVRRRGSPAWRSWKRDACAWAREEDTRRVAAQERFAAERVRLRLELLWAAPVAGVGAPLPGGARHSHRGAHPAERTPRASPADRARGRFAG
jgi:hypothetical protein